MFVDFGDKYLAPAKPKWQNPPSPYRKPAPKKTPWKPKKYTRPDRRVSPIPRNPVPGEPRRLGPRPMPAFPLEKGARVAFAVAKASKPVFRLHPLWRLFSYAWDAYDLIADADPEWYKTPSNPGGWTPAPGYRCFSYRGAIDTDMGFGYNIRSFNGGNTECNTWHYTAQALGSVIPSQTGRMWGPITIPDPAGRFNCAYVAIYPSTVPADQRNPTYTPPKVGYTTPVMAPEMQAMPDPMLSPPGRIPPPVVVTAPPYVEPAIEFAPNRPPRVVPHYQAKPKPGDKEKKRVVIKRGPIAQAVGGFFGSATEAFDAIGAVHGALPRKYQAGSNPIDQAEAIWKHLDKVDWGKAAENFVFDQLTDAAIAATMKKVIYPFVKGPAAKYWRSPVSPVAGNRRMFQNVK